MIILIDDDKYIRYAWESRARKLNIEFLCFKSFKEFFDINPSISIDSCFYIDSNLKELTPGEIQAKTLHDMGFRNIYMASGDTEIDIKNLPWIKGISSKLPPY